MDTTLHPDSTLLATRSELGGTHDGTGAADHDTPYAFGRRPNACAPFPFTTRQYVRLLILRSRIKDRELDRADTQDAHAVLFLPDGVWLASATDLLVKPEGALPSATA
jgi:hypothetical protein